MVTDFFFISFQEPISFLLIILPLFYEMLKKKVMPYLSRSVTRWCTGAPGVTIGGGFAGVTASAPTAGPAAVAGWLDGAGVEEDNIPSTITVAILSAAAAASDAPII